MLGHLQILNSKYNYMCGNIRINYHLNEYDEYVICHILEPLAIRNI